MIIQPAPATQELADDLNTYFARGRKLTDFEIKALERKAGFLKDKISFADYYAFLGLIAALRQDGEKITYNFENALKLAPADTEVLSHYLLSLKYVGMDLQALILARSQTQKLANNDHLIQMIESACDIARFHEASELLNKLENPQLFPWYSLIIEAVDIFDRAQLGDDEAEQLQQLAFSVFREHKLYFSGSTISIINDFIHYEIYVDLPIAQIPKLDFELSLTFAEKLENMRNDVIVFEYKSVETLKK